MSDVRNLEPKPLWNHFADLNAVPRPSKKEERVIDFIMNFGKQLGLPTTKDATGNVLIRKPGSKGMENRPTVVLQSHLDMVHQKNNDTAFDFDQQGIEMVVDGDWVKANGTTLGADNGIGVASIMALLTSAEIVHPPIEALFTIDEETGMTGVNGLEAGFLSGNILLNLDTEDDRELTIGCAGGVDFTAEANYTPEPVPDGMAWFEIKLKGLTGGHSGMDIHLGRGNANKLMNRVLQSLGRHHPIRISSIEGGGLRNAIPRESMAHIAAPADHAGSIKQALDELQKELKEEHHSTDPQLSLTLSDTGPLGSLLPEDVGKRLLNAIYASQVGIYRMSPDMPDLVQTSNNLSRVSVGNGMISIQCLTRSAVESEKMDLTESLRGAFELMGAEVKMASNYPGWTPKPEAAIVKTMTHLYKQEFKAEPLVNACHAGLECGIIGKNYPDMEMISFGPNIRGAHSPDEKVQISSVQKFWHFLLITLMHI